MKNKPLQFSPGAMIPAGQPCSGAQRLPALTLADGSQILLSGYDPACSNPRRYKRHALRLPTMDTRNSLGALFAKAPAMLAALNMADYVTDPKNADIVTAEDLRRTRRAIKAAL